MRYPTFLRTLCLCATLFPALASAQEGDASCDAPRSLERDGIGGTLTDFARLAEITGHSPLRPGIIRRWSDAPVVEVCGDVPWSTQLGPMIAEDGELTLRVLPPRSRAVVNTGYPNDRNNGALWAGRGLSAELEGGVALRWGPLSAALAPAVVVQQNTDFVESPWREIGGIDWPQRFGTRPYASLELGQSYLRVDTHGVAAGISTENVWFGPGISNSILMSNTAPGFAHAFVGTSDPVDVYVGHLELEVIYGKLVQSPLYDGDATSEHRLFTSLAFDLEPRGVPGLYLGGARVLYQKIDETTLAFPLFYGFFGRGGRDELSQLLALYGRWVLPESGFEVFGEWARSDGAADFHGLLTELDHSAGYVAGFQKIQEARPGWVRIYGEAASLNPRLPAFRHAGKGYWYTHGDVRQGYTHRGQLLGASIGPGSDSQLLGVDLLADWGSSGLYVERVRRAVDTFFANAALRQPKPFRYDLELTLGGRGAYFIGPVRANAGLSYSHRRSRDFLPPDVDDLERGYPVDSNWSLELGVSWHPSLSQRMLLDRPIVQRGEDR